MITNDIFVTIVGPSPAAVFIIYSFFNVLYSFSALSLYIFRRGQAPALHDAYISVFFKNKKFGVFLFHFSPSNNASIGTPKIFAIT